MFGYRVPAPDQAMLISGGKSKDNAPFQVIIGHGKFILPGFRRVRYLTLRMQEAEVTEQCATKQGITLIVKAVIAFKVGSDSESIINAGQRFLTDEDQMPTLTGRIFAGHLRSIVGSMTVEEIVTERQRLAEEVLDGSKTEMIKIGLVVDSFQIQSIDDMRSGYIEKMSAPHVAAIQRQAQIAQAQANQAAAEAEQTSQQRQLEYARETQIVKTQAEAEVATAQQEAERTRVEADRKTAIARANAKAEVDKSQAQAAQAGPLTTAMAQKDVIAAQAALATQQAELKQRQLLAEVVRPAEAEAEKIRILAAADAEKARLAAEAAEAGNRVSLDQALIMQLPAIVEKAASGLAGSQLTVLNGNDGIGEMLAGAATQGLAIYDLLRNRLTNVTSNTNETTPTASRTAASQLPQPVSTAKPQPTMNPGQQRNSPATVSRNSK